ncbi:MAG: fatty acid desaturase, partial [Flavobacteriales bacterium]
MRVRALKYLLVFSLPLSAALSFLSYSWLTYVTLIYAFAAIPALELILPASRINLDQLQVEVVKKDRLYDWLLYLAVPIQWGMLFFFLFSIQEDLSNPDLIGRILAMGILNGVFGINVAHELGHRASKFEQNLAKALLCTSLYMHFFIEHNQGHHKHVATAEDPASARKGEWLYSFWLRSLFMSYASAWKIQMQNLKRKKVAFFSLRNEMLVFQLLQSALLFTVLIGFGGKELFVKCADELNT